MIKDEFGREFLSLSNLSSLLNLSHKQTLRHVRDRNLLSKKFGKTRGVLKNDVIQIYPHIAEQIANIVDNRDSETPSSNQNVHFESRIGGVGDISVYKPDEKQNVIISKIESLSNIIGEFEKRTENLRRIERDTLANHKILGRIESKSSANRHRGLWFNIFIVLAILTTAAIMLFGFVQSREIYRNTQEAYVSQTTAQQTSIDSLTAQYEKLASNYNHTTRQYEQTINNMQSEIEQLQTKVTEYESQPTANSATVVTNFNQ